jgi:hypothetical protein
MNVSNHIPSGIPAQVSNRKAVAQCETTIAEAQAYLQTDGPEKFGARLGVCDQFAEREIIEGRLYIRPFPDVADMIHDEFVAMRRAG